MTTLVQTQSNAGSSLSLPVTVSTTAGNAMVATITAWMTSNTAIHIASVEDSAGNNWSYSTAANNANPPAAGVYDAANTLYGFTAEAVCLPSGNDGTTKAVTSVTVTFSTTPTSWAEMGVSEFSGVPADAVVLAASSTNELSSLVTSYTTPAISPASSGTVLAVASTSCINGEFTGASAGWSTITYGDTLGGYALAASGDVSATFTLASAADVPSCAILAIGVASNPSPPPSMILFIGS